MKKAVLFVLSFVLLSGIFSIPVFAENLFINGNFDYDPQGLDNWSYDNVGVYHSDWKKIRFAESNFSGNNVYNNTTLVSGGVYTMSFSLNCEDGSANIYTGLTSGYTENVFHCVGGGVSTSTTVHFTQICNPSWCNNGRPITVRLESADGTMPVAIDVTNFSIEQLSYTAPTYYRTYTDYTNQNGEGNVVHMTVNGAYGLHNPSAEVYQVMEKKSTGEWIMSTCMLNQAFNQGNDIGYYFDTVSLGDKITEVVVYSGLEANCNNREALTLDTVLEGNGSSTIYTISADGTAIGTDVGTYNLEVAKQGVTNAGQDTVYNASDTAVNTMGTVVPIGFGVLIASTVLYKALGWFKALAVMKGK